MKKSFSDLEILAKEIPSENVKFGQSQLFSQTMTPTRSIVAIVF